MRHTLSLALLAALCACSSTVYPPAQPSPAPAPATAAVPGLQGAPQPPFDATAITPVESAGAAAADESA